MAGGSSCYYYSKGLKTSRKCSYYYYNQNGATQEGAGGRAAGALNWSDAPAHPCLPAARPCGCSRHQPATFTPWATPPPPGVSGPRMLVTAPPRRP